MPLQMTAGERETFLAAPRIAVLSIPEDGRGPLSAPVWYDYRAGGELWFLTQSTSRKGRLLAVGTRVSLVVQTEDAPYRYVSLEGPVTRIEPYGLEQDLQPMAVRYLGAAAGARYVEGARETHARDNSIKVTVRPERWLTTDYGKRG